MRSFVTLAALAACGDNLAADELFQSGSRLRLIAYEADGARTFDRHVLYDAERREDCTVTLFASGERHCMPVTAGGTTFFTESTCQRVVGATRGVAELPRYFIRSFLLRGIELPSRLYAPGDRIAAPMFVWRQQDSFCLGPYEADPTLAYHDVGAVTLDTELAQVRVGDTLRGERLALAIDTSSDGLRMPGALRDELFDLPCSLLPTANDDARCVPDDVPRTTYFADASCTAPLLAATPTLHESWQTGCWDILHESGARHSGTVYERLGENCVEVPAPLMPLYAAGAAMRIAEVARERVPGGRLHSTGLAGFDDVVLDGLFHDTALEADCAFSSGSCVPFASLPVRTFFSDMGCVTPVDVVFVPTGACQPRHAYAGDRRIDGVYPGPIYEYTTGDRCAAYVPPARFEVHALAAPATDLVPVARVID